jgi:hypothetical protein
VPARLTFITSHNSADAIVYGKLKNLALFGGSMIFKSLADSIIVRSKDGSHKGNTMAAIPGAFAEVKFDAHGSTFMMFYSACENPDCSCADVVVTFAEKHSRRKHGNLRTEFGVALDVNTWHTGRLYGADLNTKPLIDEFVTGLNAEHKGKILVKYRSFRQAIENAARFSLAAGKVRKGHMVAADEVFGVSNVANSCGLTRLLLEEHKGNVYRLVDLYCMNPSCKCGDTHLSVFRADKDAAASDKPWITLRLHFEGKVGLRHVTGSLTSQQAVMLIAEWIQKDPALLGDIEERYRRIKEIGRRILRSKVK